MGRISSIQLTLPLSSKDCLYYVVRLNYKHNQSYFFNKSYRFFSASDATDTPWILFQLRFRIRNKFQTDSILLIT